MLQQRWSFNTVPSDVSVQCWLWEQVWAVLIEIKAYCCWSGSHPAKGLAFAQVGLYSSHNGKKYFCHRWLGSFLVAPGPQTHTYSHLPTYMHVLVQSLRPSCATHHEWWGSWCTDTMWAGLQNTWTAACCISHTPHCMLHRQMRNRVCLAWPSTDGFLCYCPVLQCWAHIGSCLFSMSSLFFSSDHYALRLMFVSVAVK